MTQIALEKDTNKPLFYIGRDEKIYPLISDSWTILHDSPASDHPFTIFHIQDDKILHASHVTSDALVRLSEMGIDVQIYNEDSNEIH